MTAKPKYLGHLNVNVRDVDLSRDWYEKILGLHTYDHVPGQMAFMSANKDESHEIALTAASADAPDIQSGQLGLGHMAWKVESLDDLKETYHLLKENDIKIAPSDHGISMGLYFHDPDGNGVEVYYELPRDQWYTDHNIFRNDDRPSGQFPGPWDEASS